MDTSLAENSKPFQDWLTEDAVQQGSLLGPPESFSREHSRRVLGECAGIHDRRVAGGQQNAHAERVADVHPFFARELSGGQRPIAEPAAKRTITSTTEWSFQVTYDADSKSNGPAVTIKKIDRNGNVGNCSTGTAPPRDATWPRVKSSATPSSTAPT